MSDGETAYLALAIVGFVVFALALAWITHSENRHSHSYSAPISRR